MAMTTNSAPPFGDGLREYEPDREERARHFKKLAVLDECDRRIARMYPPARQVQILAARSALSVKHLSLDARRMIETDVQSFDRFIECIALHRLAAQALCDAIDAHKLDPRTADISNDAFWRFERGEGIRDKDTAEAG